MEQRNATRERDPIWNILREQGRKMPWLARKIGYRYSYVRKVACGDCLPSSEFRSACASALDMPEAVLFVPGNYDRRSTVATAEVA